ncbi:MAG: hypothetical protein AAFP90_11620, partial [Planctomycetota bacterium]
YQLLDELAATLRNGSFDQRALIAAICNSATYQRDVSLSHASDANAVSPADATTIQRHRAGFAVRTPRMMTPAQWLRSVAVILDRQELIGSDAHARRVRALRGEAPASLGNDPFSWQSTSQSILIQLSGETTDPLADITKLYQRMLSRPPTAEELAMGNAMPSSQLLFVLMHSNEFHTNR